MSAAAPITSMYVHVPFCAHKCSYCAFYSEPSSGELINRYVRALIGELELIAPDVRPATVFFGGGTPSLLNVRQWEQILGAMQRLGLLGASEWTVECNPATVSLDKARLLRAWGVNRISMGVQSLEAALLERLGRIHTPEMVFKSYDILRQAGFDNVNLDLMFAIPGQSLRAWRDTLRETLAMGSEHLSSYEVIYEEDTVLYQQLQAGEFDQDDDLACAMYEELVEQTARAGFEQYEVANFARRAGKPDAFKKNPQPESFEPASSGCGIEILGGPWDGLHTEGPLSPSEGEREKPRQIKDVVHVRDSSIRPKCSMESAGTNQPAVPQYACRHNVNYWRGGSFYGAGPSATSYVRGLRTKNWANTPLYCEQLERGRRAVESTEELSPLRRAGETAAFGLRMVAGWPFEEFRRVTGQDLRREWATAMERLEHQGWGVLMPDHFKLTRLGLRFADAAAQEFLR
ncbi:MAG TPA: coproporphyrinogen-III oxidase family protein [Verrucomicrobiae bacterium]|nr:coproporphyrinogen-III oxidase family protein [Verrucomicrobiae bacterium]